MKHKLGKQWNNYHHIYWTKKKTEIADNYTMKVKEQQPKRKKGLSIDRQAF